MANLPSLPEIDLLGLTAELVSIPSVSFEERELADHVERTLRAAPHLEVHRVGDNVVARTNHGLGQRVLFAGHLDTVPASAGQGVRLDGDVLWGLGSADMKAGLAAMMALAMHAVRAAVDLTFVFYVAEEVAAEHSGLLELDRESPELLAADVAILGEPTDGVVEAGCQGTLRAVVRVGGVRAHSARSWLGVNAIHRAAQVIDAVAAWPGRSVTIDGCTFREGLQVVRVEGGVANNVVPDAATITINHRFAPDRSVDDAWSRVVELIGGIDGVLGIEMVDSSPGALPHLGHPLFAELLAATGSAARAKFGWTDVARFSAWGVPATNFGAGDPELAHTTDERVTREALDRSFAALWRVVHRGDGQR